MTRLLLCVDGGGTNTRARLMTVAGEILGIARSGPGNVSTDPVGAANNLAACWREVAVVAGLDPDRPQDVRLAAGLAGSLADAQLARFLQTCLPFAERLVVTDGYAALVGAGGGLPCALLVAGTGVAGHRLYADGTSLLRDGWGWLMGDRGSAVWFGLHALRHTLAVLDGVSPPGSLADAVLDTARSEAGRLRPWLADMRPSRLGALAPLVFACEPTDSTAAALVRRGLAHLARLSAQLGLSAAVPFYLAGGLADVVGPRLSALLDHDVVAPRADALHGCYLVATNQAPGENRISGPPGTGEAHAAIHAG